MFRLSRLSLLFFVVLANACSLKAQFGPPEPQGSGPKLSTPTVFPPPGTYPTTESITLLDEDPQATLHYTLDGSTPTSKSPAYDPQKLLSIDGIYVGNQGLKSGYTIRAVAMREGRTNSEIANFEFVVDRRDHTAYVSEEILPGVRMIRDSDNDKMFLIRGAKKYALIDSGMGRGALRGYISQFTGGLPVEVIFTHNHPDHIGQADEFVRKSVEHIGEADRAGLVKLLASRGISDELIAKNVVSAHDGDRIDIGDRSLVIYAAPGHTPGSIVVFDEDTGYLFTGDAFGSNSPTVPDALWMQWSTTPLDRYLAMVKNCREKFHGKVKYIMTGHNDQPLVGEKYLDNLETALQSLMDEGDAVLVPSYRPSGLKQVVVGDRLHDHNWVAINVNQNTYLPAPIDKIAGLTRISVEGAKLSPIFSPAVTEYTVTVRAEIHAIGVIAEPTSTRSKVLSMNGEVVKAGVSNELPLTVKSRGVGIRVLSPDGTRTMDYVLKILKR